MPKEPKAPKAPKAPRAPRVPKEPKKKGPKRNPWSDSGSDDELHDDLTKGDAALAAKLAQSDRGPRRAAGE